MTRTNIAFVVTSLFLSSISTTHSLPLLLNNDYEQHLAKDKQNKLFNILKTQQGTSGSYPNKLQLLNFLLFEDVQPTMDHISDILPYHHGKRIHSVGGVATVAFESAVASNHTYSGLFEKDAPFGIIRLSLAKEATTQRTIPGIAVKLFRDGMESANFVAMYSLDGQESGNFFENKFSNHVPDPLSEDVKTLAKKFQKVERLVGSVGLSDIASYKVNGEKVKEENINFPFQLILDPNPKLTAAFEGSTPDADLRTMLSSIEADTKLYDVYARSEPTDNDVQLIGALRMTSGIIYSKLGDEMLFFKHQRQSEDLVFRPEWKSYHLQPHNDTLRRGCPMMSRVLDQQSFVHEDTIETTTRMLSSYQ